MPMMKLKKKSEAASLQPFPFSQPPASDPYNFHAEVLYD